MVSNSKKISKINSIFLIHRVQDLYSENVTNKLCARKTHGFNTSTAIDICEVKNSEKYYQITYS